MQCKRDVLKATIDLLQQLEQQNKVSRSYWAPAVQEFGFLAELFTLVSEQVLCDTLEEVLGGCDDVAKRADRPPSSSTGSKRITTGLNGATTSAKKRKGPSKSANSKVRVFDGFRCWVGHKACRSESNNVATQSHNAIGAFEVY